MDDVCLIHHNLKTLQEMLDITNHVALNYHIELGSAKCKVVRIGKWKNKSGIKLNGQTLEEVDMYKYLGELISKKNNMEAHTEAI